MADAKISQLPVATTPLAGTEVLPVVQGGITEQVSVANLTAGRAVSAASVSTTGNIVSNTLLRVTGAGQIEQNGAAGGLYFLNTAVSGGATNQRFYTTNASGVAQLQLQMVGGATQTNNLYGDTRLETGNLIPATAAKGINFTANTPAAGMTSQLLNWYEEGTWTPNQGAGLVVTGTFSSSGRYTRIGRQVTITAQLNATTSLSAASGGVLCSNIPFTAGNDSSGTRHNINLADGGVVYVQSLTVYTVEAVAATTRLYFSVTYFV